VPYKLGEEVVEVPTPANVDGFVVGFKGALMLCSTGDTTEVVVAEGMPAGLLVVRSV
jgi:hypothetical protein